VPLATTSLATTSATFVVDKFEVGVSSGFYVRQFVADLAKSLLGVATTFSIKRIRIGDYKIPPDLQKL
jgi:tRNA U55 pseudouridine synthase TruB